MVGAAVVGACLGFLPCLVFTLLADPVDDAAAWN